MNGAAQVHLDPEFAATIRAEDYDVFLTLYGDCRGLYVVSRSPVGLEVRELGGGSATLEFGYRVVASRRDDVGSRLDRVTVLTRRVDAPRDAPGETRVPDLRTAPLPGGERRRADEPGER